MLDRIREAAQGPIAKTILIVVIITFAFTGVSAYLGGSVDDYVAKVNDREISRIEFDRAYQNQRATMEQQFGEMFNMLAADENYMRQLRSSVLEQLIEEQLAIELATSMGLAQSADALRQTIRQTPEFQINGQFSNDIYLRTISSIGFTPTGFRDYLADQMSRVALMQGALASEFGLANEGERLQVLQNELRSGRFATISAEQFMAEVVVEDAEVQDFYADNQDAFQLEERIQLAYLALDYNDVVASIEVADSAVRAYYENNTAAFSSSESRSIAHILVEFGDDEAAARERIEAIAARLAGGEDFAALAATESDDIFSGADGGELGLLERDSLDPDLEDAGFALQAEGDISPVVRSEFGYHLVKLTALNEGSTQSFADVADMIRANLAQEQAERRYFELQQELARITFEVEHSLEDAAEALGLTIQTSPWLRRNEPVDGYSDQRLLSQAFSEEVREMGLNSELIELDERSLVVRAADYQAARVQDLAEVRDDIVNYLQGEKAEAAAAAAAEQMLAQLQAGEQVALSFNDINAVGRFGSELPGAVRQQLFRMPANEQTFALVTLANGDAAIVELTEVMPGVVDAEQADRAKRQLEGQYAELAYQALIDALKEKATIVRRL